MPFHPFHPFQPNYQSTPTSHLPLASSSSSSSHVNVQCWENEDKENRRSRMVRQRGGKTSIQGGRKKTPSKLSRRNERERNRVHLLNQGFDRLRAVVPKREGEYLSKISTLRKAIWYIEHLDKVLKEDCNAVASASAAVAVAVAGEESGGDSGVVGTELDSGRMMMETQQSLTGGRQEEGVEEEGGEEMERLSPIFPPRMEELVAAKPLPFLSLESKVESGYLSGSLETPGVIEKYPAPPPVRVWKLDFDAASTPNR